MTRKVKIIDAVTGEELRETYTSNVPTLFGALKLTPADIIKFGSALIMIIIFFVNGQNDKKIMQENLLELKATTRRLVDFKENSDGWDSQVYGTRFRDGQPVDNTFNYNRNRQNITYSDRQPIYKTTSSLDN